MAPSPNQNAFFAALQQRSRLPDTATTWRWVGRDEAGLAIIRSDNGTIARARIAGNAAIGDGDVVLYVPPQRGQSLGQVQLATALAPEFIRRRQLEEIAPEPVRFTTKALLFRFLPDDTLEFFIGADRPEPEKVFEIPPGFNAPSPDQRAITATGTGPNDWLACVGVTNFAGTEQRLYLFSASASRMVTVPMSDSIECYGSFAAVFSFPSSTQSIVTTHQISGVGISQSATSSKVGDLVGVADLHLRNVGNAQQFSASTDNAASVTVFNPIIIGAVWNPADNSWWGQGPLTAIEPDGSFLFRVYDSGSNFSGTTIPSLLFGFVAPTGATNTFGQSIYRFFGLDSSPALPGAEGTINTATMVETIVSGTPTENSFPIEYYGFGGTGLSILNASYFPGG